MAALFRPSIRCAGAVAAGLFQLSTAVQAQPQPDPEDSARSAPLERSDPKACRPSRETTGSSTSDRLAQTEGVICPPHGVDPDIRLPTPQGGTTPVIPPPGSPGGDQTIRPK